MATKDSIKHFRDVDNYNTYLEKKDIDDNFDLLADTIDSNAENSVLTSDDVKFWQRKPELGFVLGANDYDLQDSDNGDIKTFFEKNVIAFRSGKVTNTNWDKANLKNNTFGFGTDTFNAGDDSFVFGNIAETINNSFFVGFNSKNIIPNAKGIGLGTTIFDNRSIKVITPTNTTDDTEQVFNLPLNLKSCNYFNIKVSAMKDDYSTKWIFYYDGYTIIKDDGSASTSTSYHEYVKDDDNWNFEISATADSENPTLDLKITGVADTNIVWQVTTDLQIATWL